MAAVRPQLPLLTSLTDNKTGRITQPWSFYFTTLQNSLPEPGTNNSTFGTITATQVNTIGLTATNGQIKTLTGNNANFSGTVTADLFVGTIQGSINSAVSAQKAVNLEYGNAGQVVYQIAPGLTGYITVGANGQFLTLANGKPTWGNTNQGYGTGGGPISNTDEVFFLNGQTVTESYTIPPGFNASSVGPITISGNAIVTLSDNSIWYIEGN